ncbi:MAG: ATP-binding protein [Clostridiales bacterium]|nr:ATP-binding protein [Clostridiales bacterium]
MNNKVYELEVAALTEKLPKVTEFVDLHLEEAGCSMKAQMQIDIAVEEIFVNIAHYAYEPGTGNAVIRMAIKDNPLRAEIAFIDSGTPYNPLEKKDPDVTLSAEDRQIGGLGIYMTKKSMDDVTYEFKDGHNILTLVKNL